MTKVTDTYEDAMDDKKITKGQCSRQELCRFDADNFGGDDDDSDVGDDHLLHRGSIHVDSQRH